MMTSTAGEEEDPTANNETSPSTPNSNSNTAHNSNSKSSALATKDRSCPFCGQAFTSSSLGRHLDLYIRPKNPKSADGVHDVDEIKKLRGGITRRQPRTSGRVTAGSGNGSGSHGNRYSRQESAALVQDAQGDDDDSSMRPITRAESDTPINSINSPGHARDVHGTATVFNRANWQATGVINNLPPRAPSRNQSPQPIAAGQAQAVQDMRRDAGGTRIQRPEHESESMWKLQEAAEMGRAAEMALREVLGSLEAAAKKVEPKLLYDDFDFFSLSFPGLCLAILPPPGTLFSPTPFPSAESWTLGPPGLRQYETMTRFLNELLTQRRKQDTFPDSLAFKYHAHLSAAWEHFEAMVERDRASAWQLEVLRSFTRSQERNSQLRSELERSQQHNHHLEAEYDRLSRCQLPRDYLTHPPNTIPVAPAVMKEIRSSNLTSGAAEANYNAEVMISKWRSTIRATTRPSRVSQPAPPQQAIYEESATRNDMQEDMVMNGSMWNIGGPLPRTAHSEAHREVSSISYETPPNPGAVVGGATDDDATPNNDADADGEAETEEDYRHHGEQAALMKRGRVDGSLHHVMGSPRQDTNLLNVNGKRPLGGRSSMRILKETVRPR